MEINDEMRKMINSEDFSLEDLQNIARKQGMVTMFEDGLKKIESGLTTVEEVFRVIRE
jgi:type IV pilus assembly protein PilB